MLGRGAAVTVLVKLVKARHVCQKYVKLGIG